MTSFQLNVLYTNSTQFTDSSFVVAQSSGTFFHLLSFKDYDSVNRNENYSFL